MRERDTERVGHSGRGRRGWDEEGGGVGGKTGLCDSSRYFLL